MSNSDRIVKINVGGRMFMTRAKTLLKAHYFETLLELTDFDAKVEGGAAATSDGIGPVSSSLFIDRSPEYFAIVLDYLRSGIVSCPSSLCVNRLQQEFDYFGVNIPSATSSSRAATEQAEKHVTTVVTEIDDATDPENNQSSELKLNVTKTKSNEIYQWDPKLGVIDDEDVQKGRKAFRGVPGQIVQVQTFIPTIVEGADSLYVSTDKYLNEMGALGWVVRTSCIFEGMRLFIMQMPIYDYHICTKNLEGEAHYTDLNGVGGLKL